MKTSLKNNQYCGSDCPPGYFQMVYNLISRRFGILGEVPAKAEESEVLVDKLTQLTHSPPGATVKRILIYIGTQTGTAEDYATTIEAHIRDVWPIVSNHIRRIDLIDADPFEPRDYDDLNIFIVSTYGNGEPPENSRAFWQRLTDDTVGDIWADKPILVIGLGHSAFPKFCQFGKDLYAKLVSLGAFPLADLIQMDGLQGQDDERLITCVDSALTPFFRAEAVPEGMTDSRASEPSTSFSLVDDYGNLSTTVRKAAVSDSFRIEKISLLDDRSSSVSDDEVRNYEVTVSVNESDIDANITKLYAGGAVGFFPPISDEETDSLLKAYYWIAPNGAEVIGTDLGNKLIHSNEAHVLGRSIPDGISVRDLFKSFIDFDHTEERLSFYRDILPADHPLTREINDEGESWLENKIVKSRVSVKDFIFAARNIQDFLMHLEKVFLLPRVKMRQYSIASSLTNMSDDRKAFRLVITRDVAGRVVESSFSRPTPLVGRMTAVLDRFANGRDEPLTIWGCGSDSQIHPGHWNEPGVWVATGSGIAPFLGLLDERKESNYKPIKPTVLVYGCRTSSPKDFLGRNQIVEAVKLGLVTDVILTFSREESSNMKMVRINKISGELETMDEEFEDGKDIYVGDVIRKLGMLKDILEFVRNKEGLAILCGSLRMSGPVLQGMTEIIGSSKHISQIIDNQHLVLELW